MHYKLYASYGVLAHEKRPVFTDTIPASDFYDVITVDIPDKYPISENIFGQTLIDIEGETYLLHEVLNNFGDDPCLSWYNEHEVRRVMLKVL